MCYEFYFVIYFYNFYELYYHFFEKKGKDSCKCYLIITFILIDIPKLIIIVIQ